MSRDLAVSITLFVGTPTKVRYPLISETPKISECRIHGVEDRLGCRIWGLGVQVSKLDG